MISKLPPDVTAAPQLERCPHLVRSSKRTVLILAAYAVSVACNSSMALDPTFGGQEGSDSSAATATSSTTSDGEESLDTSTTSNGFGGGSSGGPTCGNGILEDEELCDDGDADDTDACTATCIPAACGDGIVQPAREECDAGALNDPSSSCNAGCKLNVCGDGDRGPDESCDDGNIDDTDACTSLCQTAVCGDGLVHVDNESCDAQGDSETCDGDCTPAECGDGYTNRASGEECDDGNQSSLDNCYPSCTAPTMLVFVTSEVYQGDLGGLVGADAKCQSLAQKAGVVGTFKAWLSTSEVPSATRLYHSPGRYMRLDGMVVADNFEQLRYGPMHAPVSITDTKQPIEEPYGVASFWSGEGGFSDVDDGYCDDWTSSSWDDLGSITPTYVSGYGTNDAAVSWTNCYSSSKALLCVQQAWYPEDPTPR